MDQNSFAYRFAGFGTHEWVVYYDLVRHLICSLVELRPDASLEKTESAEQLIATLEQIKTDWLESPQADLDGHIPAIIIDNERKRLPQAMSAAEIMIDEDCDLCRMSALEAEMGFGPTFWHLDGCNMDDGFAFSSCRTLEEWEVENREREEFDREFNRKMEENRKN